jgi:hypothetical protein
MNYEDNVRLCEEDGVPTWLETPVTAIPSELPPDMLPTVTRLQTLPLHRLEWENFERLCLKCARDHGTVMRSQLYGVKGQAQQGIDLYVRRSDPPSYEVYQCKRVEEFTPTVIREAVEEFLNGTWRDRASAFRIMTSYPIEDAKLAEAIESAGKKLEDQKIVFEVLGEAQLSEWLKDKPRIVDDFFSRPWVEPFCGPDALKEIGKRLNAQDVAQYRKELKRFYETIFNRHDPGIPVPTQLGERELSFRERFVIPDVFAATGNWLSVRAGEANDRGSTRGSETSSEKSNQPVSIPVPLEEIRVRFGIDRWLSQSHRSVVLGGPGSGKSVLLRVLAIELLSEEPVFKEAAARWGTLLPIWIPFSFWTSLNARQPSAVAFSECLETWFRQFGQKEVWRLVEAALEDDRLLLLVDSLDEWTDETAARTTSDLLHAYIQLHGFPAILVSRPHGFDRVSLQGPDWQRGTLAPLSPLQARELAVKWLGIHRRRLAQRSKEATEGENSDDVLKEAADFISKLAKSNDLTQLAEVPLTLLLLLLLHLQNSPLPANRFEAYEHVTQYFIREHPLARRVAATVTGDQEILSAVDIRNALASIAYFVQTNFPAGTLSLDEITGHLETFLQDNTGLGLGLSRAEAREVLRSFTNIEEGSLGLLVSQGQSLVSFFHRSLQEYLASVHLSRMSLNEQQNTVAEHIGDARWREVIVGVVSLCRRSEEGDALVHTIEQTEPDLLTSLRRDDVLSEIGFGDTNISQLCAKHLIAQTFDAIETSSIDSHRSRLLTHAMSGLRARKSKTAVRERIKRWIFSRGLWGPGRLAGMRLWPRTEHTWQVLYRSLHDEDAGVMREAGEIAAYIFGKQEQQGNSIAEMAMRADNPLQRAACIECLAKGWPDHAALPELIEKGRGSVSNEIKIASLAARVRLGQQQDDDLDALLSLSQDRFDSATDYSWHPEPANSLARGFPKDVRLKQQCLKSVGHHSFHPGLMDGQAAVFVAVNAFPQDDEIAAMIAQQLKRDHPFLTADSIWKFLHSNFENHPVVIAALDEWMANRTTPDVIALHYGSLVGKTPLMKKKLFAALNEWVPFWAVGALLEGWGMSDPETSEKLLERAQRDDAAEIGHFIPQIYKDPTKARDRLMDLLRAESPSRIDTLIQGFSELLPIDNAAEIVTLTLQRLQSRSPWRDDSAISSLILTFPGDERVRQLARESLNATNPPFSAIEEAYFNDERLCIEVGEMITPLPAALRYQIVSDLPIYADVGFAKEVLRHWDAEHNVEIKTQASIQFHSLLSTTDPERTAIIESLDGSLPCYGPDYEGRRQAIGAGLIVLNQLERVVGKIEVGGFQGQQINIPVTDGSRKNRMFLEVLGKHWLYIKQALRGDLNILDSRIGSKDCWEHLAGVASQYRELSKDVYVEVETNRDLRLSPRYLEMLSRLEPRSDNLANACIAVISDNAQRHDWFDAVETAAVILAEQFYGDTSIESRLVALSGPYHIPTDVVMALSLGWQNSHLLQALELDGQSPDMQAGELYPKYALISPSGAPQAIELDLLVLQR